MNLVAAYVSRRISLPSADRKSAPTHVGGYGSGHKGVKKVCEILSRLHPLTVR